MGASAPPAHTNPGAQLLPLTLVEPAGQQERPAGAVHGRHAAADVAPRAAEKRPTAHGWHESGVAAPLVGENVPAGQGVQAAEEVAPCAALKVPREQLVQVGAPASAKAPAAQALQVALLLAAMAALAVPAAQRKQPASLVRPGVAASPQLPAGQGSAGEAPPVQKKPTGHCDPAGVAEPGPHAAPGAAVQGRHLAELLAPTSAVYLPASQGMQGEAQVL